MTTRWGRAVVAVAGLLALALTLTMLFANPAQANDDLDLFLAQKPANSAQERVLRHSDPTEQSAKTSFGSKKTTQKLFKAAVRETYEVMQGYAEEGGRGAFIEALGGMANVGVTALQNTDRRVVARACAQLKAWPAIGSCLVITEGLRVLGPKRTENIVEAVAERLIGRPEEGAAPNAGRRRLGGTGRMVGDIRISVFVDGNIIASARGANSSAENNIGVAKAGGTSIVVNVDGTISTIATGSSDARTDVGIASGRGAEVMVDVNGNITTVAGGNSSALTEVGIASGNNSSVMVSTNGDIYTSAQGSSTSTSSVGVALGDRSEVMVDVNGNISTIATGASSASTEIGIAHGAGASATAIVGGNVTTMSTGRAQAHTGIGVANSGDVTAIVGQDVTTIATGAGRSETLIGTGSGGQTIVNGGVVTQNTGRKSATTEIGTNGSAMVKNVLNFGGNVSVGGGGACKATRDGQCCLDIYLQRCVTRIVPRDHGACPPGFIPAYGACYFIPDTIHRIDR